MYREDIGMKQFDVHINTGIRNYNMEIRASSPKEAALQACSLVAMQYNIKIQRDRIVKCIIKKEWRGDWSSWWGSLIEVTELGTNKYNSYELSATIDTDR